MIVSRANAWLSRKARSPVSVILLGTLIGQGSVLLVSPVLTRLYSPEAFGTYALVVAASAILGGLVSLSWERAVAVPRSERIASSVVSLGVVSVVLLSVIVTVVALVFREQFASYTGHDVFVEYWWLVPATAMAIGLYGLMSQLLVRLRSYRALGVRNAVLGGSQAASSVGLGALGLTPLGLISSVLIGRVVAMAGMSRQLRRWWPGPVSTRLMRATAHRYRNFPLISTWSRVLNTAGLQMPVLLIVTLYGSAEAGLFALTVRVLAVPASFVTDAVSQYFEGTLAYRARNDLGGLRAFIVRVSAQLAAIAALPSLIVLAWGPGMFAVIFGADWSEAGQVARIMTLAYFAQFAVAPVSRTLLVLERQALLLAWDILRAVLTVGAVVLPHLLGLGFTAAVVCLTAAQILAYALLLTACVSAASKRE